MKIYAILLALVFVAIATTVVLAKGPSAPAGNSNTAHLYLYEKDSEWDIVSDGAWGKMKYNLSGTMFDYVFNGHDLMAGEDYTLIYYPDPWPGTGLKCLGSGVANNGGNLNLQNALVTGDMPIAGDTNPGAKIWLVRSSDISCDYVTWNVVGEWNWLVLYTYEHDLVITQQNPNGTFTGTGGYPAGEDPYETSEIITGKVTGLNIELTTTYTGPYNSGYSVTVHGVINPVDGTISGLDPWEWHSTEGSATSVSGMMTGWDPTEYLFEEALINFDEVL